MVAFEAAATRTSACSVASVTEEETSRKRERPQASELAGGVVVALCAGVLFGWLFGFHRIVQLHPALVPMQFNAALGSLPLRRGAPAAGAGASMGGGQAETYLLVEDDERDVELTLAALREQNIANDVEVVRDGEAALDDLHRRNRYRTRSEEEPVVVLLDLEMPKVSGLEVLRDIKSTPELKPLPVVVLSTSREERDLVESYALGVNPHVVKPVELDEFVSAIKQLSLFWAVVRHLPSAAGNGGHGASREP